MVDQVTQGCIVTVNTPEMIIKQCLDKTENINCDKRIIVLFKNVSYQYSLPSTKTYNLIQ